MCLGIQSIEIYHRKFGCIWQPRRIDGDSSIQTHACSTPENANYRGMYRDREQDRNIRAYTRFTSKQECQAYVGLHVHSYDTRMKFVNDIITVA